MRLKTVLLALVVGAAAFLAVFLPASSASAATDTDYGTWSSALERNKVTVKPSSATSVLGNCTGTTCRSGWYTQQANKTWQIRTVPATAPVQNPGTVLPNVKPAVPGVAAPKLGARIGAGVGQAALAITGVDMIYSGVGAITHAITGTTSNGLACDFAALFNPSACQMGPAPDYTPNLDVTLGSPGWTSGGVHTVPLLNGTGTGQVSMDIMEFTSSLEFLITRGPIDGSSWNVEPYYQIRVIGTNTVSGAEVHIYSGKPVALYLGNAQVPGVSQATWVVTLPANRQWERVEFLSNTTVVDTWYPQAHPLRPEEPNPNPVRRFTTTSECIGSAGAYTNVATSISFFETDVEWPPLPDPDCGQDTLTAWQVDQITEGMEPQRVYEWEIEPELQQALADLPLEQLSGNLQLDLFRLDDTYEISCFQHPELCNDWFDDPAREDLFVCRYGGEVVPLAECFVYRPTFSYAKFLQGIEHADEEGNLPEPSSPPVTPDQNNSCPPPFQWSSLVNPWYYYKSFSCTLTEMFVPAQSPQTRVQTTYATLQDSAIGTIGRFFPLIPPLFDIGPNRCGLLVDVELPTLNPLGASGNRVQVDTCDGIWAEADPIRAILGAAFIISGAFFALRIILKTIRVESVSEVSA